MATGASATQCAMSLLLPCRCNALQHAPSAILIGALASCHCPKPSEPFALNTRLTAYWRHLLRGDYVLVNPQRNVARTTVARIRNRRETGILRQVTVLQFAQNARARQALVITAIREGGFFEASEVEDATEDADFWDALDPPSQRQCGLGHHHSQ